MRVHLEYGTSGLEIDIPSHRVDVISPGYVDGLADERARFVEAVRRPFAADGSDDGAPLRERIRPGERVAIVIPDITRPLPTDRLLPWIFEELAHLSPDSFVIVNGTGSHRSNTAAELARMVGADVLARYRVVNHDAYEPTGLALAGHDTDGRPIHLARDYVEADRRIVLGFIEPHFMAGFSGGYKGVFPAIAGIDAIMHYHRADVIGHPRSTWGILEGNPTQRQIQHNGSLVPVDFLVNVTLNRRRQITRFFCGDVRAAHQAGCAFARATAMRACPSAFPIVVTTNSGYPLDQNLYQTVKGMHAAAQIVAPGGFILAASRCNDGFPDHGNFKRLLFDHPSPRALLETITRPGFSLYDQWEAQLLALVRLRAEVGLYSELAPEDVRRAHLEPVADIAGRLAAEIRRRGPDTSIAVLPEGPQTIPYLA
jgi:nickel-dependent lactate racemase